MAKQLEFSEAARHSLKTGVDKLANAVKVTLVSVVNVRSSYRPVLFLALIEREC